MPPNLLAHYLYLWETTVVRQAIETARASVSSGAHSSSYGTHRRHRGRAANDKAAQQRLVNNAAEAMQRVPREIVERQLGHFAKPDPKYAEGVADALGMTLRQAAE
jgi:catalase